MNPTISGFDFIFQIEVLVWTIVLGLSSYWAGFIMLKPMSQLEAPKDSKFKFRLLDVYVLVFQCFFLGWMLFLIRARDENWRHFEAIGFSWALCVWWWALGIANLSKLPKELLGLKRIALLGLLSPMAHGGVLFPFISVPVLFFFIDPKGYDDLNQGQRSVLAVFIFLLVPIWSLFGGKMLLYWCTKDMPDLAALVQASSSRRRIFRLKRKPQASDPK